MSVKRISEKYINNSIDFYHVDFNDRATYNVFSLNIGDHIGDNTIKSKLTTIAEVKQDKSPYTQYVGDKITLRTDCDNGISSGRKVSMTLNSPSTVNFSLLMVYQIEDGIDGSNVWIPDLHSSITPTVYSPENGFKSVSPLSLAVGTSSVYTTSDFTFTDSVGLGPVDVTFNISIDLDLRGTNGVISLTADTGTIINFIKSVTWDGIHQTVHLEFEHSSATGVYSVDFVIDYMYLFPLIFVGADGGSGDRLLLGLDYYTNSFVIKCGDVDTTVVYGASFSNLAGFTVIGVRSFATDILELSVNGRDTYYFNNSQSIHPIALNLSWVSGGAPGDFGGVVGNTTTYNFGELIYVNDSISDLDWKDLNAYLINKWIR
jgi:hypothetical protein